MAGGSQWDAVYINSKIKILRLFLSAILISTNRKFWNGSDASDLHYESFRIGNPSEDLLRLSLFSSGPSRNSGIEH